VSAQRDSKYVRQINFTFNELEKCAADGGRRGCVGFQVKDPWVTFKSRVFSYPAVRGGKQRDCKKKRKSENEIKGGGGRGRDQKKTPPDQEGILK